jgi:hypothetical protein
MRRGLLLSFALVLSATMGPSDPGARAAKPLFPAELGPLPVQAAPTPLPSLSAQTCNACHGAIHDQWAGSGHARASTNPVYLAAARAAGDPLICRDCHLPLENQRADLASGKGKLGASERIANPAYQPSLALEGVTCAACHVRDGVILGPRTLDAERSPHPVRAEPALRGAEACAPCHQAVLPGGEEHPFIDTLGEWARSPYADAGVDCAECHMGRVSGIVAGSRYATFASHAMTRTYHPEELRRALTLEVGIRSTRVVRGDSMRATATLMNTGAGHAVPTGIPSAAIRIRFDVEDSSGVAPKGAEPTHTDLRRVVSDEAPYAVESDNRLPAAGSRTFDYTWKVPKKLSPGRLFLVVRVERYAISAEEAESVGVDPAAIRTLIIEQRIPFEIE